MTKNVFAGFIGAIAFLLIWTASNVAPATSVGYFIATLALMGIYSVAQYRYGKSYR